MDEYQIIFARSDRGREYVTEFINTLDQDPFGHTTHLIELLAQHGHGVSPKYIKRIHHKIYELRVLGKVQVRILLAFNNNEIILLHAFKKKSSRIPPKEITTAISRLNKLHLTV
ncbi:MAG: type II toxin-antitoxin system RelE/ParE family toxin [bacterium]|nr:type II toxin-antitoxin system RelE/ParE family toxin [bacterium]